MAIFPLSITIKDSYNRTTSKRFIVDALTYDLAYVIAADLVGDLDGLITGQIISAVLGEYLPLNGKDTPGIGSNIDEGITFVVWLDKQPPQKYAMKIPTPDPTYIGGDGRVDMTDAAVVAWIDDFTGVVKVPVSDGDFVDSFILGQLDKN